MTPFKTLTLIVLSGLFSLLLSGAVPALAQDGSAEGIIRPAGWDDYSHGEDTDPDYAVVFPQDKVNTITLTIAPETWQAMLDDMTEIYGAPGSGRGGMGGLRPQGDFQPPEGFNPGQAAPGDFQPPEGAQPPAGMGIRPGRMEGVPAGQAGQNDMRIGGMFGSGRDPIWVSATLEFEDQTWTQIGIRFKGNSSLASSWNSGNMKLAFRLNFDKFENDYPETDNQRFYGFKRLTFANNWSDSSLLREKVTGDIFREAGVPAAQTAFYAVYIDYGQGPVYFGLYTAVEVVEESVITAQFEDDSGNVYKPEGSGATFAAGSFSESAFVKKTNEKAADYSDILALYDALHAETRTTDPAAWRRGLEAVFDADGFMRWLAVNTVIQNWDTYGRMSHNYYLYNNPATGQLTWIPWDNNMALGDGMGGGIGGGMGGRGDASRSAASLDHESVGNNWPLIRYLMDDPVYYEQYVSYIEQTIQGAFAPTKMEATYRALHALIAPYVVGENGEQAGYTHLSSAAAFDNALTELINHANQRYALAQAYVAAYNSSRASAE